MHIFHALHKNNTKYDELLYFPKNHSQIIHKMCVKLVELHSVKVDIATSKLGINVLSKRIELRSIVKYVFGTVGVTVQII